MLWKISLIFFVFNFTSVTVYGAVNLWESIYKFNAISNGKCLNLRERDLM